MSDHKSNPERDRWFEDAKNYDIEGVASLLGVKLKKSGRDLHSSCPVCGGRDGNEFILTPGNKSNEQFLCRKSGVGGGVVSMVMHCQSIPDGAKGFVEACEFIMGGPPPGDEATQLTDEEKASREQKRAEDRKRIADQDEQRQKDDAKRKKSEYEKALDIWGSGIPIAGTLAMEYLRAREATPTMEQSKDLRFIASHPFWAQNSETQEWGKVSDLPCMTAAICNPKTFEIQGVHQTYLDPENIGKKAAVPAGSKSKKIRGEAGGGMIFLGAPTSSIAVGEGIESVESWSSLGLGPDDISLATSISLGNLCGSPTATILHPENRRLRREMEADGRKVTDTRIANGIPDMDRPGLSLPAVVRDVYILGDGDSDKARTYAAVLTAARRFKNQGFRVFVHFSPEGLDWNDFVRRRAAGEDLDIPPILTFEEFETVAERAIRQPSRFGRVSWASVDDPGPEHSYLIDGFLTKSDKSVIGGPSQSGKSFLAIHIGLCLARGMKFFGRDCEKTLVVYQAGEGSRGVKKRLRAFRKHYGVPHDEDVPFELLTSAVDLYAKDGDTQALIAEIKQIQSDWPEMKNLIFFIDTLATATAGADENSGKDMSAVMKNIDLIARATGAHVCLVHHMNAAGTKLRGHTSIYANIDQVMLVTRNETTGVRTAVLDKQKDDESGIKLQFELKAINLGEDAKGKPITSCVCLNVGEKDAIRKEEESKGFTLRGEEVPYFRAVLNAIKMHGAPVPRDMDLPAQVRSIVGNSDINKLYLQSQPIDEDMAGKTEEEIKEIKDAHWEKLKKRMQAARKQLNKFGIIGIQDQTIWWTGKPVRGFAETMPPKPVKVDDTAPLPALTPELADVDVGF